MSFVNLTICKSAFLAGQFCQLLTGAVQNLFTIELITPRYRYGLGIMLVCLPSAHHIQKALRGCSTRDFTSATNLASNGELLSFRHIKETEKLTFKSLTGKRTTPGGHRHREALLTKATPTQHCTRLSSIVSFGASWTMRGSFSPPREHAFIKRSWTFGITNFGNATKDTSAKSRNLMDTLHDASIHSAGPDT